MPDIIVRRIFSKITDESAIDVLKRITPSTKLIGNLNRYIVYMVKTYRSVASVRNSVHGHKQIGHIHYNNQSPFGLPRNLNMQLINIDNLVSFKDHRRVYH